MKRSITFFMVYSCVFLVFTMISTSDLHSQQDPMYTQYMFNKVVYNPAVVGSNREFYCFSFLHHNQWVGFGNDNALSGMAPVTSTFSFNTPIEKIINGLGIYVVDDRLGWRYKTSFNLAVSLKHDLSFGTFQYGLNGGMIQAGIDPKWDPHDPEPLPGAESDMKPDLGGGMYLFTNKYYIGLSAQHLLPVRFKWEPVENILVPHYYMTAGNTIKLIRMPTIKILPSVLVKTDMASLQFDAGASLLYKDKIWGGLQYREGTSVNLLAGYRRGRFRMGYSYDMSTNNIRNYSSGTHEVYIELCFRIFEPVGKIIWTPRFL